MTQHCQKIEISRVNIVFIKAETIALSHSKLFPIFDEVKDILNTFYSSVQSII